MYRWRVTVFHALGSQTEKFSHATCRSYADYFYSAAVQLIASVCDCRSHFLLFQASSGTDNGITGEAGNSTDPILQRVLQPALSCTHCHLHRYSNYLVLKVALISLHSMTYSANMPLQKRSAFLPTFMLQQIYRSEPNSLSWDGLG